MEGAYRRTLSRSSPIVHILWAAQLFYCKNGGGRGRDPHTVIIKHINEIGTPYRLRRNCLRRSLFLPPLLPLPPTISRTASYARCKYSSARVHLWELKRKLLRIISRKLCMASHQHAQYLPIYFSLPYYYPSYWTRRHFSKHLQLVWGEQLFPFTPAWHLFQRLLLGLFSTSKRDGGFGDKKPFIDWLCHCELLFVEKWGILFLIMRIFFQGAILV